MQLAALAPRTKRRCRASKKKRQRQKKRGALQQDRNVEFEDDEKKQAQSHTEHQVQNQRKTADDSVEIPRTQQQLKRLQYLYSPKDVHAQVPTQDREQHRRSRDDEHNGDEEETILEDKRKRGANILHSQAYLAATSISTATLSARSTTGNEGDKEAKRQRLGKNPAAQSTQQPESAQQQLDPLRITMLLNKENVRNEAPSMGVETSLQEKNSRSEKEHVKAPKPTHNSSEKSLPRRDNSSLPDQHQDRSSEQKLVRAEFGAMEANQENSAMSKIVRVVHSPEKMKSMDKPLVEKKRKLSDANSPKRLSKPSPHDSDSQSGTLGPSFQSITGNRRKGRDDDTNEPDEMSEYERKRRDAILRNQTVLDQLGMSAAKAIISGDANAKTKKEALAVKRARRAARNAKLPRRRSRRLSGEPLPVLTERIMKKMHQPQGSTLYVMDANDKDGKKFCRETAGGVDVLEQSATVDIDDSIEYSLADKDVVKGLPNKTTTMAFLPRDRLVVAAGDTKGHVTLWSPSSDNSSSMAALSRPHSKAVSQVLFPEPSILLSSSVDGTVCELDLGSAHSSVVCQLPKKIGITSLAGSRHPRLCYASCDDGTLRLVDCRAQKEPSASYVLHEEEITSVDQHPRLNFCIATTSMDGDVCLWDKRMISAEQCVPLARLRHRSSVLSACFSPQDGSWLAVVGQKSYFDVYNLSSLGMCERSDGDIFTQSEWIRVRHNTAARPRPAWDPRRRNRFVIGCIDLPYKLQIFQAGDSCPSQELIQTKVPSFDVVTAYHPHFDLIASGSLSGYLSLWRANSKSIH